MDCPVVNRVRYLALQSPRFPPDGLPRPRERRLEYTIRDPRRLGWRLDTGSRLGSGSPPASRGSDDEDCANGTDDDANGAVGCADPDCASWNACEEVCGNGIDNDADLAVDCEDSDCAAEPIRLSVLLPNGPFEEPGGWMEFSIDGLWSIGIVEVEIGWTPASACDGYVDNVRFYLGDYRG